MTERPILFNGEMVRAILEGRKTQTRRVIKKINPESELDLFGQIFPDKESVGVRFHQKHQYGNTTSVVCPYGKVGDVLWVRETFFHEETSDEYGDGVVVGPLYRADFPLHWDAKDTEHGEDVTLEASDYKWKPSIYMPRWASRITLEVVSVRVERVQDLELERDALAEGITFDGRYYRSVKHPVKGGLKCWPTSEIAFKELWDSINNKRGFGWDKNVWVWVVEFKRVED